MSELHGERLAVLETKVETALGLLEKISTKQDATHDALQQVQGAARMARWLGHGLTALIAFGVTQLSGGHLPPWLAR